MKPSPRGGFLIIACASNPFPLRKTGNGMIAGAQGAGIVLIAGIRFDCSGRKAGFRLQGLHPLFQQPFARFRCLPAGRTAATGMQPSPPAPEKNGTCDARRAFRRILHASRSGNTVDGACPLPIYAFFPPTHFSLFSICRFQAIIKVRTPPRRAGREEACVRRVVIQVTLRAADTIRKYKMASPERSIS